MNNLPSPSPESILRPFGERSHTGVRRVRVRPLTLSPEQPPVSPSPIRPLLHLVSFPPQTPSLPTFLEQGIGYYHGAEPLAPLRDRDLRVLDAWFATEEMGAIEADIIQSLQYRYPEPCWEDNALGFLNEYL